MTTASQEECPLGPQRSSGRHLALELGAGLGPRGPISPLKVVLPKGSATPGLEPRTAILAGFPLASGTKVMEQPCVRCSRTPTPSLGPSNCSGASKPRNHFHLMHDKFRLMDGSHGPFLHSRNCTNLQTKTILANC